MTVRLVGYDVGTIAPPANLTVLTDAELAGLGLFGVSATTVRLTANQIRSLFTVPVELVPAPGAGLAVQVVSIAIVSRTLAVYGPAGLTSGWSSDPTVRSLGAGDEFNTVGSLYSQGALQTLAGVVPLVDADNRALQVVSDTTLNVGAIAAAGVNAAGTGYGIGDTGEIDQAGGVPATYTVLTVGGAGEVLTFSLTSGGSGYVAPTVGATTTVLTGGGDGAFTVDITAITPGNATAVITTIYKAVPTV